MAQGKSNEEIGIILGIATPDSGKGHLELGFVRLGVWNRAWPAVSKPGGGGRQA